MKKDIAEGRQETNGKVGSGLWVRGGVVLGWVGGEEGVAGVGGGG